MLQHCGQWGQGQGNPIPDYNVTIDGFTAATAFDAWLSATVEASTIPKTASSKLEADPWRAFPALKQKVAAAGYDVSGWSISHSLRGQANSEETVSTAASSTVAAGRQLWLQDVPYPCNDCCNGGSGKATRNTAVSSGTEHSLPVYPWLKVIA